MSLFWLNPNGFLSFDRHTTAYFKKHDIVLRHKTAAEYFAWLEQVVAKAGGNFPQISLEAYEADMRGSLEEDDQEGDGQRQPTPVDKPLRFWVEKTYRDGRPGRTAFGSALWSPQAGRGGRNIYRLMRDVKPGDLVFHFVENKEIVGVSRVAGERDDAFVVPEGTRWPAGKAAFLIPLEDYSELAMPIDRSDFLDNPKYRSRLLDIKSNNDSLVFNSSLELNEGAYLTKAPLQLVQIWEEIYRHKTGDRLPLVPPKLLPTLIKKGGLSNPPFTKADALNDLFIPEAELDVILARLKRKLAIILQGPPGVGKTFIAHRLAFALMGERDEHRVKMVQFHPSYGYEDFVQGYRPTRFGLRRRDGVFLEFASLARNDPERDWFFIIDEINRGNLAKIFGELLMLLEADKRGRDHAIPLTYSKKDETFDFPPNLYVIGTMNTADRSLAMVDYALRRRFAFVTLDPAFDFPSFAAWLTERGVSAELLDRIRNRVRALNQAIEKERDLGPGFRIGHSFFCAPGDHKRDDAWYRDVIQSEIEPLLEEYFDSRERVSSLVGEFLA
jgi:hypothetical protein